MQPQRRRVLETSKGQLQWDDIAEYHFVPHEYLSHEVSQSNTGQISILTLQSHLSTPWNTVNTSITPTLILHQLHSIKHKILLLDASPCRDLEPFQHLTVIKGTKVDVNLNVSSQEASYIYSKQTIKQTLENNFSLAALKPSFVGEFYLQEMDMGNEYVRNSVEAAMALGKETGCPLIFNMVTPKHCSTIFPSSTPFLEQTYNKMFQILDLNSKYSTNIVIYNPLAVIKAEVKDDTVTKKYETRGKVDKLRQMGGMIGYDLLRYQQDKDFLLLLVNEAKENPDNTIFSSGALFKTDLKSFGGKGLDLDEILGVATHILPTDTKTKVFRDNLLNKLFWKTKEIVVRQIEYWTCSFCGKVQAEDTKKFQKMGKEFCSTACIRNYKF